MAEETATFWLNRREVVSEANQGLINRPIISTENSRFTYTGQVNMLTVSTENPRAQTVCRLISTLLVPSEISCNDP